MIVNIDFNAIAKDIVSTINGKQMPILYFKYIGSFMSEKDVPKGCNGIYIFTLTEDIKLTDNMRKEYNSATNWNNSYVGANINFPYPDEMRTGAVFYVGKTSGKQSSVYKRLKTHFGDRTESATNGIKMKMPERKFLDGKLCAHVFLFEEKDKKYNFIIDGVEKELHFILKPIAGGSQ